MKKLGLIITPLMAISLLTSCNNGGDNPGPTPGTTYTLTFNCEDCKAFDENDKEITKVDITLSSPYTTYHKFFLRLNSDVKYKKIVKSSISVEKTNSNKDIDFEYNPLTGEIN